MMSAREAMRYVVYTYRWRPNVSCEACHWLVQGTYELRGEAEAHVANLLAAGERARVLHERDV